MCDSDSRSPAKSKVVPRGASNLCGFIGRAQMLQLDKSRDQEFFATGITRLRSSLLALEIGKGSSTSARLRSISG